MTVKKVSEVIKEIRSKYGKEVARKAEQCCILVNGRNISFLKGFQTMLDQSDLVQILPFSGGG